MSQSNPDTMWQDIGGTFVAEISCLEHSHRIRSNGAVELLNGDTVHLKDCAVDKDYAGEDIAGWRCEVGGRKYLIIND